MPKAIPPAVVHIPHSSQSIPQDILASFAISPDALRSELLLMSDHFTDELFCLPDDVAPSVVYP